MTDESGKKLLGWLNVTTDPTFVHIDQADWNGWKEMSAHPLVWIYYSIILGGLSIFLICLAAYKWIGFIRVQGCGYTIPNVVLPVEIISNLCTLGLLFSVLDLTLAIVRAIFVIVDPIMTRLLWPYIATSIFLTITFPFELLTTLLITLYNSFPHIIAINTISHLNLGIGIN